MILIDIGVQGAVAVPDQSGALVQALRERIFESGDDQILSAVMSAPPCLSGLSQEESDGFAHMWRERKFPAELKRKSYLEGVAKALYLGGTLLVSYGRNLHRRGTPIRF